MSLQPDSPTRQDPLAFMQVLLDSESFVTDATAAAVEGKPPRRVADNLIAQLRAKMDRAIGHAQEAQPAAISESYLDSLAEPLPRISTRLGALDKAIGDGVHPGGLVIPSVDIVAGAPKTSKTTLAQCIVENCVRNGATVLVYDFENGQRRYFQRMLCRVVKAGPLGLQGSPE